METIKKIAAFGAKTLLRQQNGVALAIGEKLGCSYYDKIFRYSIAINVIEHLLPSLPLEREEKLIEILIDQTEKNYLFILEEEKPVRFGEIIIPNKNDSFTLMQFNFYGKYSKITATSSMSNFPEIHLVDDLGNKKTILQFTELKNWKVWSQEAPSGTRINICLNH